MLTIYKITNKKNGFVYVGQTSCGINMRWARHIISAFKKARKRRRRGTYISKFHRAIKQHGINCFEIKVVRKVENSVANKTEKEYIQKFTMLGKSYNMKHSGMFGMHHSNEGKQNIAKSMLGLKRGPYNVSNRKGISLRKRVYVSSKLTRLRMSKVKNGVNNPMFGRRKINGKWVASC